MIQKVNQNILNNIEKHNQKFQNKIEFEKILNNVQAKNNLKISSHASVRLKDRNINLNEKDMSNLNEAVEKIRNKGGREALIIYNNVAFITSIRNNTIITAVDSQNLKENVFTNIDSALIL